MFVATRALLLVFLMTMVQPATAEILSSRADVKAYFSKAVFLEKSKKLGTDIQSSFDKGRWTQSTLDGKKLGSARLKIKKDGKVCPEWWQGKCLSIDVVKGGFYFIGSSGKRGEKLFRKVK